MTPRTEASVDLGYVILGDYNAYRYQRIPCSLIKALGEINNEGREIRSVVITPSLGWLILCDESNGYQFEGIDSSLQDAMEELYDSDSKIHDVSVSPTGDWVILYDHIGYWTSRTAPDRLKDALASLNDELDGEKHRIHQVALGANGSWIIFYSTYRYWQSGMPTSLLDAIEAVCARRLFLKHVSLPPGQGWFLLYGRNGRRFWRVPASIREQLDGLREPHTIAFCSGVQNCPETTPESDSPVLWPEVDDSDWY